MGVVSAFTTGHLVDWDYRRHTKQANLLALRNVRQDVTNFNVENLRISRSAVLLPQNRGHDRLRLGGGSEGQPRGAGYPSLRHGVAYYCHVAGVERFDGGFVARAVGDDY